MTLILNCIIDEKPRVQFDAVVVPRMAELSGGPVEVARLADPEPLPDPTGYSRVVLSGSELSAADGAPRDEELIRFIRKAAFGGTAILGICYGHQMIARALASDTACGKAKPPEFGWRKIDLVRNPLFEGIDALISAESHYDEVLALPEEFEVIASTRECAVQAFQVIGTKVWGVQFHPEVDHARGDAMFARNVATDERARANFANEMTDAAELEANDRIFRNFFTVTVAGAIRS
jgi:GMP synthase-like glutamine amidotransferase